MEIAYSGTLSQRAWTRAQRLHAGWRLWVWPFFFPVVMTAYFWIDHQRNPHDTNGRVLGVFALGCLFPVFMWVWAHRNYAATFRKSPYLREPVHGAILDGGVKFESASSSGLIPWSRFIRRKQSDDMVLLYQAPNLFNVVPREFFESAEAWQQARALIAQSVTPPN